MAVKDSIGGWKDNAFVFKSPNSCSVLQKHLGPEWPICMERMGFNVPNCPLPSVNIVVNSVCLIRRFY